MCRNKPVGDRPVIREDKGRGRAIVINPKDNVATVIRTGPGTAIYQIMDKAGQESCGVKAAEPMDFGHKIALEPIPASGKVVKYGEVIGRATAHICTGDHVHVHNMESCRGKGK